MLKTTIRSNSKFLSPESEICGVFSSKNLPPTSETQSRATAITYIVLSVTWVTLTSNSTLTIAQQYGYLNNANTNKHNYKHKL